MKQTRYTEKEIQAAYSEWQQSGLSKKAFCEQAKLPCSTFHYWIKKIGSQGRPPVPGFIEMDIIETNIKPTPQAPEVEIEYPSGIKLRFYRLTDANLLKSLI